MPDLAFYISAFSNLSVKKDGNVLKPNKAILLISLMDLIRCGYISNNSILLEDTIQEAFEYNWKMYLNSKPPTAWTPFWHMKRESFWHFHPFESMEIVNALAKPGETASVAKMRTAIRYAFIDDELFALFKRQDTRTKLHDVLIKTYIALL